MNDRYGWLGFLPWAFVLSGLLFTGISFALLGLVVLTVGLVQLTRAR